MDYEFRFFRDGVCEALHMTAVDSDAEACERATLYLQNSPQFSHVEIRRGMSFMRRITNDFLPGEAKPLPASALS